MQRFEELIPSPSTVREKLAENSREATMLRRLMKLSLDAQRKVEEHRQIFGLSQPSRERTVLS